MWKTLAVFCVVLLVVIYVEAGPGRKGKGQAAGQGAAAGRKTKGGNVTDPNCSDWTFSACVAKAPKTCGKGTKQGTRTGDNCQMKTKQMPCFVSCKAKCSYTKGDWSVCTNNQMTRTLTLKADQPTTCEATKTVNRKCKAKAKKPKTVCKYDKKAPWSACTNGKMSRTLNLKQRKAGCEATKVETKDCK